VRYHPLTRDFFRTIFNNEGKCWPEFYKYIKRHKGYKENIAAIKDCNGQPIIHLIEKAYSFNHYYYSVISTEGNFQRIQCANCGKPFTIDTKIIRKRVLVMGKNKWIGPDGISGEILKLGGEAMISYLAWLLDMTMNNGTLLRDWRRGMVFPIHKGCDRSLVTNIGWLA